MKMMKRTILALILVLIFCLTAACSVGKQPIALSQVEKVTVWTQTDNQKEISSWDSLVNLYNAYEYTGEAIGEGGTPEYGFIIYLKSGSQGSVNQFAGITGRDFEVSVADKNGKKSPAFYIENSELVTLVKDTVEAAFADGGEETTGEAQ